MSEPAELQVLFDGNCGLCSRTIQFLYAREATARFHFTPFTSDAGRRLAGTLALDPDDPSSFAVLDGGGNAHLRSDGAILALRHCRRPWPAFATLLRCVPRFVRDAIYNFIARHRLLWFGSADTCQVPEQGLIARMKVN